LRYPSQQKNNTKISTAPKVVVWLAVLMLLSINGYLVYSAYDKIIKIFPAVSSINKNETSLPLKVEIVNGCGIKGLGDKLTDILREKRVDVIQSGNYYQFNINKTVIIDRAGNNLKAKNIAKLLGIPEQQIICLTNKSLFLDVTVLAGKDFYNFKYAKEKL